MATDKTNALRILKDKGIPYTAHTYPVDSDLDGVSVARKLGVPVDQVFKTLVTRGGSGKHYVFVVPVNRELDLKQAARLTGEKHVEMLAMKDLLSVTGYVRGGCSPVGMRKAFQTWIDESACLLDEIYVSAGKIGMQVRVGPDDLRDALNAEFVNLVMQVK